jgi:hypothetical protein
MAVSSVSSGANMPPPSPQPESREATRNGKDVGSEQVADEGNQVQKAPPPDTSPQGKMVGSLVDTKA